MGLEYALMGDDAQASRHYHAAMETAARSGGEWGITGRLFLADLQLRQGLWTEARQGADQVISRGPGAPGFEHACAAAAEACLRLGEPRGAISYCWIALSVYPEAANMWLNLAALCKDEDPSMVLEFAARALRMNPYLLRPIIYREGTRRNPYRDQIGFLSCTPPLPQMMAECCERAGRTADALAWAEVGQMLL